ncbi:MAG: FAD-binding oxidoreductase [Deltaproteobacteria bacterium]|nr:MAG: FAD-binding oxidoreductase [Deltaproteobacteria bacterium]
MSIGPFIDAFPMDLAPPEQCTVAVIGASLAGVAAGLFLAREGVDVVVLEAADTLGAGQSGRDLGLAELGVVEHPHRTLRALGDRADDLLAWTTQGKELLDAEGLVTDRGLTWIASRGQEEPELDESAAALAARGIPCERLTAAQVAERTGTRGLGGGLFLPDERVISPWRSVATLATALRTHGGVLVGGARVDRVDDDGDELLVHTARFTLRAEVVILAAGYDSGALDEALSGRLTAVREQLLCTPPLPQRFPGAHRAGQGWMRWQQQPDGRLVLGGARWASPHMAIGETEVVVEDRIQDRLDAFLLAHFGVSEVEQRWAHGFATTPDGLPIIGRLPGDPRRVALVGFGATPTALAAAAGRRVADGLLCGEADVPRIFSPRRIVRWRRG